MTLKDQLDALLDATAFDSTGVKIGAVRQVYVDDATGKLTFATVSTGIFSSDAIVPLHGARLLEDELHLDHTRSVIRDSPRPDHTEDALTPDQEVKLLEYYGIEPPSSGSPAAAPASPASPARTASPAAPPTPGPDRTSDAPSEPKGKTAAAGPDGTGGEKRKEKTGETTTTKRPASEAATPQDGPAGSAEKPGTNDDERARPGKS